MVDNDVLIENIEIELNGTYYFPARIEKVKDNEYIAECVNLKGVFTQGKTLDQVRKRIKEALEEFLESFKTKLEYHPKKMPLVPIAS